MGNWRRQLANCNTNKQQQQQQQLQVQWVIVVVGTQRQRQRQTYSARDEKESAKVSETDTVCAQKRHTQIHTQTHTDTVSLSPVMIDAHCTAKWKAAENVFSLQADHKQRKAESTVDCAADSISDTIHCGLQIDTN